MGHQDLRGAMGRPGPIIEELMAKPFMSIGKTREGFHATSHPVRFPFSKTGPSPVKAFSITMFKPASVTYTTPSQANCEDSRLGKPSPSSTSKVCARVPAECVHRRQCLGQVRLQRSRHGAPRLLEAPLYIVISSDRLSTSGHAPFHWALPKWRVGPCAK